MFENMLPEIDPPMPESDPAAVEPALRSAEGREATSLPMLSDVVLKIPVTLQVVIGTARVPLAQINELAPGTTLTLEEKLGAPVAILVNGREVAKGELFVLDGEDNRLSIRIASVSSSLSDNL